MTKNRPFLILLAVSVTVALTGCAMTPVKYYRTPEGKDAVINFAGYELQVVIRAVNIYSRAGTDSFRVWIPTVYTELEGIDPESAVDSLDLLTIDSLYLRLPLTGETLWPAVDSATTSSWLVYIRGGGLYGPVFNYHRVKIPEKHTSIEVGFVARLVDRESGRELRREEFRRTVYRIHEKTRFYSH
ncbi:MAG: hypothetical protein HRF51_10395 [bacterium]|jgi:hypothetical protein